MKTGLRLPWRRLKIILKKVEDYLEEGEDCLEKSKVVLKIVVKNMFKKKKVEYCLEERFKIALKKVADYLEEGWRLSWKVEDFPEKLKIVLKSWSWMIKDGLGKGRGLMSFEAILCLIYFTIILLHILSLVMTPKLYIYPVRLEVKLPNDSACP